MDEGGEEGRNRRKKRKHKIEWKKGRKKKQK